MQAKIAIQAHHKKYAIKLIAQTVGAACCRVLRSFS